MTYNNKEKNVWVDEKTSKEYLEGIRSAIPFAEEEIELMIRIIEKAKSKESVHKILDLGCGDGILGFSILRKYPNAEVTFLDLTDSMINATKQKAEQFLQALDSNKQINIFNFTVEDLANPNSIKNITKFGPFDIIISGFAIHHLTDDRKRELYTQIFNILNEDGIFLNLERVQSRTEFGTKLNDDLYIDTFVNFHQKESSDVNRDEIAKKYYYKTMKDSNILALVEDQCEMLRKIGYSDVDIFFKIFEIALFGGRKPIN